MTNPTWATGGSVATSLTVLHLSDTHLSGDGSLHNGVVDTAAALERVLRRASVLQHIDAVVMSGDLSDDGTAASYRLLKGLVEPWATDRNAPVLYVMGNHDGRAGFDAVLGPRTGTVTIGGVRFLRLDSSVPGFGYGTVPDDQIDWLRAELRERAESGSVVVLHHPPIAAKTPLLHALELQNPARLLDAITGTDVRLVLAGHFHHPVATTVNGIPLVVAPGITNTTDVLAEPGHERTVVGAGAALVRIPVRGAAARGGHVESGERLGAPEVCFLTAPSTADGTEIFDLDPEGVAAIAAQSGAPQ